MNATKLDKCHPYLAWFFMTFNHQYGISMVIKAVHIRIITAFLEVPNKGFDV